MDKNTPFMYMVGYDRKFQENCNTGWGCGYIAIPLDHPKAIAHFERVEADRLRVSQARADEYFYVNEYYQQENSLNQEITLTETENINGVDYLVIGFDTAHSWNNETHNFGWVFRETKEMLNLINS